MLAGRILIAAFALACCAWFAAGGYAAHERTRLTDLLMAPRDLTPAQTREARTLLDHARLLNPDRGVELQAAEVDLHVRRPADAERILKQLVRDEPRNIDAWFFLGISAAHRDRLAARESRAMVTSLAPAVPPAS